MEYRDRATKKNGIQGRMGERNIVQSHEFWDLGHV